MPTGIYVRTEIHKRILVKNSIFKKGHKGYWLNKKMPPFSNDHKEKIGEAHKGNKTRSWKGGRRKVGNYIYILQPNHPFCDNMGYVLEHRLIIEKYLHRYLKSTEEGHHLGKKNDNRPQMLMAFKTKSAHQRFEKGGKFSSSEIIFDGREL